MKLNFFFEFIYHVLSHDFQFSTNVHHDPSFKDVDDTILNYSLKTIACEVFFNLKSEPTFFRQDNITECVAIIVKFALKSN